MSQHVDLLARSWCNFDLFTIAKREQGEAPRACLVQSRIDVARTPCQAMVGQLSRCRVMHAHGLMGLEYTLSVKGVEIPRRRVGQMRHRNLVVVLLCSLRPAVRLEWPTPGASTCIKRKFHANLLKRKAGVRGTHRAAMQAMRLDPVPADWDSGPAMPGRQHAQYPPRAFRDRARPREIGRAHV